MQRRKRIIGICGKQFLQTEPMKNGEIHFTCGGDDAYWLRTTYSKQDIQEEINSVCRNCEHCVK
jgi:hypothetical protein